MVDRARRGVDPARGDPGGNRRGRGRAAHGFGRRRRRGARPAHLDDHVRLPDALGSRPRAAGRRLPPTATRARAAPRRGVRPRAHHASGRARRRAERASDRAPAPPRPLSAFRRLGAGCLQTPSRRARRGSLLGRGRLLRLLDLGLGCGQRPLPGGELVALAPYALGLVGPAFLAASARRSSSATAADRDSRSASAWATACSRDSIVRIVSAAAWRSRSTSAWSRVSVCSISVSLAARSSSAASRSAIRFSTPSIAAVRCSRSLSRADNAVST